MKNEYQIEKDGQITIVNSKEEYEAFKKKYNSYDFVVMERTNKVKMISKNDEHSKTPKGMPEWFWMWSENVYNRDISKINDRIDGLEHRIDHLENRINEVEKNLTTRLDKHDEIFKRNNLS